MKLGIWILFGALLSFAVTLPLGMEMVSGALFIFATLFLWIASFSGLFRRLRRRG